MAGKSYVVLLSGTNITVGGHTGTYNAGAMVPDGADHLEHLLDVGCIGEVGGDSDLLVSAQIVGAPVLEAQATSEEESEEPASKPARGRAGA